MLIYVHSGHKIETPSKVDPETGEAYKPYILFRMPGGVPLTVYGGSGGTDALKALLGNIETHVKAGVQELRILRGIDFKPRRTDEMRGFALDMKFRPASQEEIAEAEDLESEVIRVKSRAAALSRAANGGNRTSAPSASAAKDESVVPERPTAATPSPF